MAAPKLDFKMLVVPAMLFFSKNIDFKDPAVVDLLRKCFFAVIGVVLALYYYLYTQASSSKDAKKIWVPPKPKPTLPFGMGPPPEPIKLEDFEETTYKDYEIKLLKEGVQGVVMSGGISFFMSTKFSPMPLLMQSVMIPLTLTENLLFKKYILGSKTSSTGGNLYGELLQAPTADVIAKLNAERAAEAAASSGSTPAVEETKEEPRVVELPSEDEKKDDKKAKKEENKPKEVKKATPATEID